MIAPETKRCYECGGTLIGTELDYTTCGDCGRRWTIVTGGTVSSSHGFSGKPPSPSRPSPLSRDLNGAFVGVAVGGTVALSLWIVWALADALVGWFGWPILTAALVTTFGVWGVFAIRAEERRATS